MLFSISSRVSSRDPKPKLFNAAMPGVPRYFDLRIEKLSSPGSKEWIKGSANSDLNFSIDWPMFAPTSKMSGELPPAKRAMSMNGSPPMRSLRRTKNPRDSMKFFKPTSSDSFTLVLFMPGRTAISEFATRPEDAREYRTFLFAQLHIG